MNNQTPCTKENANGLQSLNLQTKHNKINLLDQPGKRAALLYEYKLTQIYCPQLGIYAIPNIQNFRVWNCIIFVRNGFYKQGKLKFDIVFPYSFPQQAPQITFKTKVYHPIVNQNTGELALHFLLAINKQKWNYLKDNVMYHVFTSLKSMFLQRSFYQPQKYDEAANPQAVLVFRQNPHEFIQKSMQCVEQSIDRLYQNQQGTSLVIKNYQNNQTAQIRKKLHQLTNVQGSTLQKSKKLYKFLTQAN